MTVYVDSEKAVYYNMRMSHMVADTLTELHEMADKIGLKRYWFQDHRVPHYDICQNKRAKAIAAGAVVIATRKEFVTLMFKMGLINYGRSISPGNRRDDCSPTMSEIYTQGTEELEELMNKSMAEISGEHLPPPILNERLD
jgi:hypothetical protein